MGLFVLKQEKLETIVEILVSEEDDAEEDVRDRRQRRGSTISQGQVVDSNGLEGFLVGKDFPTLLKKRIDGNHSTVMYFPSSLGSQEIVNAITAIHDQKSLVLVSQSRLEHWVTALSQISKTSVTFGDLSKVGQASSVHVATVEDVCKESQLSGFRAVLWAVGPVEMVDNSEAIGSAVARISEGLTDAARILLANALLQRVSMYLCQLFVFFIPENYPHQPCFTDISNKFDATEWFPHLTR
ncbi:hypothetical protein BC829DRAFT_79955 [Chytridium lagenaria]|nr:hypothetical protein BC829DRAFT_79955 [Chytridium lagenaria]